MVITALKVQSKNKERVNVYLDEKFFCGLQMETVYKFGLRVGGEVTKEKLEEIQLSSEKQVAFTKVLNLISKYPKTVKQVKDYLNQKGYVPSVVGYVVEKLKDYNYVNDQTFTKNYINANIKTKGLRRLKQELIQKGVSSKIIDAELEELPDQSKQIKALVGKYMKNKEKTQKNYSKLYAYLTRRGFSYEQIQPYLKERGEN